MNEKWKIWEFEYKQRCFRSDLVKSIHPSPSIHHIGKRYVMLLRKTTMKNSISGLVIDKYLLMGDNSGNVCIEHTSEAVLYKSLDRDLRK